MGIAVASQQGEVLEAIQVFRRKARDAGNLRSTPEQMVTTEPASDRPEVANVIIQPARPEICYIPVYDPYVVVNRVVVAPSYPLITFGLGFTFGAYGSWLWHDIHWGWWDPWNYRYWGGIYLHDSPYYWSQPRSPGWWYGPHRPPLWQAPYRPGGGMHARGKHGGGMDGGGGPGGLAPGGYSGAHGMKPLGWDSRSSPTLRPYSSVSPPARTSRGAQSLGRRTSPSSTRPPTSLSTPRSLPGPTPTAPRVFGGTSATPRTYGPFGNSVRTTGPSPGAAGVRTTTPTPGPTINRWRDRGLRSLTPSSTSVPRTTNVPRAVPSTSTTVRRATPPTIAPTTRYGASSRRSVPMWPTMTGRASSNRGHQSLGSRSSAAPRSSRGGRR